MTLMSKIAALAPVALLSLTLPAMAADKNASDPNRHRCAYRSDIMGYSVLDDRHFLLRTGPRGHFLVTVTRGCSGMKTGINLVIESGPASGPCVDRGDRVMVERLHRCTVWQVEYVESREAALKLIEARAKADEESESGA